MTVILEEILTYRRQLAKGMGASTRYPALVDSIYCAESSQRRQYTCLYYSFSNTDPHSMASVAVVLLLSIPVGLSTCAAILVIAEAVARWQHDPQLPTVNAPGLYDLFNVRAKRHFLRDGGLLLKAVDNVGDTCFVPKYSPLMAISSA
jgi:hypothetical protein